MRGNDITSRLRKCRIDVRIPLLHLLNLFDGILTLYSLRWGIEELNPLMNLFYGVSPPFFLVTKVSLVAAATGFLDKNLSEKYRWVLTALVGIYLMVLGWHIYGMILLWDGWYFGVPMIPPAP
jgi:hypothetical protein